MNETLGALLLADGSAITLLADTLRQTQRTLRMVDGRIEASPPFTSAFGTEIMDSCQKPLLAAYNGVRRDQPLEPAHLYVCEAGCWTLIVNKRKASKCPMCGVSRKDRRVELDWTDLPKRPKRKKAS